MIHRNITATDIPVVAQLLVETVAQRNQAGATVIGLSGDLGAGKTTLVQAIASTLGVSEVVQSPTFVIMKQYDTSHPTFTQLVHMDAYRIEDITELAPLHFSAVLEQSHTLVCIEWPELIAAVLPASAQYINLTVLDADTRQLSSDILPALTT